MAIRIQLRRDTAANWTSTNPTLRAGEFGIETDTLKFKIGNGSEAFSKSISQFGLFICKKNGFLFFYNRPGHLYQ